MDVLTPEFPRPIALDTIGDRPRTITIEATGEERQALARRFGLLALDSLAATATLVREQDIVEVGGRLAAAVIQACVASGAEVPAVIDEPFTIRFVPETAGDGGDEEIELDEAQLDTVGYAGGAIDLGEAVAQTLALALDPFPRAPDADEALKKAGILSEEQASPFAKLLDIRDKLGK